MPGTGNGGMSGIADDADVGVDSADDEEFSRLCEFVIQITWCFNVDCRRADQIT